MSGTLVLGLESSCDETAAAIVRDGREVLSSVIASQIAEHAPYGGVVPELAGRSHLRQVQPVVERALALAGVSLDEVDVVAVTQKPGLIGSLLVGVSYAKALAFGRDLPLVGVDHIQAHAYAATMESEVRLPALALVVSGGHTALYRMDADYEMEHLGETLDDAAGEAFDKVAAMLGLPYPGGPSISALAVEGDPRAHAFPRYRAPEDHAAFSFSGLKTAVLYRLRGQNALAPTPAPEDIERPADVAASFQAAVVDALVATTLGELARHDLGTVLVTGGVARNPLLRERLARAASEHGAQAVFPSPDYCTDNAAMIAGLGYQLWRAGRTSGWDMDAAPR